jgi:hypothetical protein
MAENRQVYTNPGIVVGRESRVPVLLGAPGEGGRQGLFTVYSYALNKKAPDTAPEEHRDKGGIEGDDKEKHSFPGNISPEGYFYSPFHEVKLKELDDELQTINVKRINFVPSNASKRVATVTFYDPETGVIRDQQKQIIKITSPVTYEFLEGRPFCIYDAMEDVTYRGFLSAFTEENNGQCTLYIATDADIDADDLTGKTDGISRYYIGMLEDNAPAYAEYIPATNKMIWRGPKKMSDLDSQSPLYNMPFTNGRLYIHKIVNMFVRRQDPHGGYMLFRPALNNPLRRYQIEGNPGIDFDYIQYIIDSMVDAC